MFVIDPLKLLFALLNVLLFSGSICAQQAKESMTFNVMAPLDMEYHCKDEEELNERFSSLKINLKTMRKAGVDAVSVDIWWGKVEEEKDVTDPKSNGWNWSYYDKFFKAISEVNDDNTDIQEHLLNHKLKIIPIMSFHQCGGNVGDNCNVPIPSWVWTKYVDQGVRPSDMRYKSERLNESIEYVSLWADDQVIEQYVQFMKAFQEHFTKYVNIIQEINISTGPAGELRYPSYNQHDGKVCDWPNRGCFQSYSKRAIIAFRTHVLDKKFSWANQYPPEKIKPPFDSSAADGLANSLDYQSDYAKDFIDWYNESLVSHGNKILSEANEVFSTGDFKKIPLGIKIPGVHWLMGHPDKARLAEIPSGLIANRNDFGNGNSEKTASSFGNAYRRTLDMVKSFEDIRQVNLHFTCLEKSDNNDQENGYSLAKTLVGDMGDLASGSKYGIVIMGENARPDDIDSPQFWGNIYEAIKYHGYRGVTILRMDDLLGNNKRLDDLKDLIKKSKSP